MANNNVLRLIQNMDPNNEDRDTLPPTPETEPPPALSIMPSDTLKRLAGYDESLFLHAALTAAADNAHLERERQKKAIDPAVLLAQARAEFETVVTRGYEMIREPVAETLREIRALAPRVKATEDDVKALRVEFAALRAAQTLADVRMSEIEIALGLKTATT
jgi:hypothetical protein